MEKVNSGSNFTKQKADAFINISLPVKGGANKKLGSIALYADQWAHKALIDDPALLDKIFTKKVDVNLHVVETETGDGQLAL